MNHLLLVTICSERIEKIFLSNIEWQKGAVRISKNILISYLLSFLIFSGVGAFFLFNPLGTREADAAWFNDNWSYRKTLSFTHNATVSTATQIEFDIDTTAAPDSFQADCGDVRFTTASGEILPYYYPGTDACDNASTDFDVLVPSIINGTNYIYMYYGNPSAQNGTEAADFSEATTTPSGGAASAGSEEISPSPSAYWKFDDGQGTTVEDATSGNKDGSITGAAWKTEDLCLDGKCLSYDGASDYVDYGTSLNLGSALTVSAWVKLNTNTVADYVRPIFAKGQWGSDADGDVRLVLYGATCATQSGTGRFAVEIQTSSGFTCVIDTIDAPTNVWVFLSATWDGSTIRLYRNGVEVNSSARGGTLANNAHSTFVGAYPNNEANTTINGFIDEVKLYKSALTAAQIKANYNSRSNPEGLSAQLGNNTRNMPGALSNGLVGYWKMDESSGNRADSSGVANTLTDNNTVTSGTGKFGIGADFEEDNLESLTIADNTSLQLGTTITLATWVNLESLDSCSSCTFRILGKGNHSQSGSAQISYGLEMYGDTNITSGIRSYITTDGTTGTRTTHAVTTPINTGTWYHLVWTYDGITSKLYKDGLLIGSQAMTGTPYDDNTTFMVGGSLNGSYDGLMDEARVYNRVLSNMEITHLYKWAPGPVGYWKMDEGTGNTLTDSSGNGNTSSTFSGNVSYINGKYNKGLTFDGNDDLVRIPESTTTDLGNTTNSYSVGAWIKTTHDYSASGQIVSKNGGSSTSPFILYINVNEQASFLIEDGTNTPFIFGTTSLNDGKWHYLVGVRDVPTDNLYLYVDGKLEASTTDTTTATTVNNDDIVIGNGSTSYNTDDFNGQIDEAKVYNYARTQAQIIEDMNAGHPAPGSPVGSALGHWRFDEGADNTCSGGSNDVCNNGNSGNSYDGTSTATRTNNGKFNRALDFDGTDDVVTITNGTAIDMDGNLANFTFSGWVNADSDGEADTGQVFSKGANTYLRVDSQSGSNLDIECNLDRATTDTNVNVSTAFAISTWNHVACSWDRTTLSVYVNGLLRGSSTSGSGAISSDANNLLIGGGTSNNFDGKIDEFKIFSQVLTAEQIKLDMNRGSAQVLGALSASSNAQANSASNEYCPPDTSASVCTSPVLEFKLDEGSGTTANDTSGNGNTGTTTAGTGGYVNGKINKAYNFDGADTVINAGSGSTLDDMGGISIEAWIYPRSVGEGSNAFIVDKNLGNSQSAGWIFHYTSNQGLLFVVDGSTDLVRQSSNSVVPLNRWSHVALSWGGNMASASTARIFVNGIETGYQTTTNGASRVSDAARSLYVGNASSSDRTFNGIIDQVRVYNYGRTPAQIAWSYNKGGPFAHWKMDECQGTTINDITGNSYTGTLTVSGSGETDIGSCITASSAWGGASGTNAGKVNYGLNFDGTDDDVTITGLLGSPLDVSISAWVNVSGIDSSGAEIFSIGDYVSIRADDGSSNNTAGFFYNGSVWTATDSTLNINGTGWRHIVYTFTSGAQRIYVDGILRGSTSIAGPISYSTLGSNTKIGEHGNGSANYNLTGMVDDVKVFNYPLTATQVKTLYTDGAVRFGPTSGAP